MRLDQPQARMLPLRAAIHRLLPGRTRYAAGPIAGPNAAAASADTPTKMVVSASLVSVLVRCCSRRHRSWYQRHAAICHQLHALCVPHGSEERRADDVTRLLID